MNELKKAAETEIGNMYLSKREGFHIALLQIWYQYQILDVDRLNWFEPV